MNYIATLELTPRGECSKVFLADGEELAGVTSVTVHAKVGEPTRVTIEAFIGEVAQLTAKLSEDGHASTDS